MISQLLCSSPDLFSCFPENYWQNIHICVQFLKPECLPFNTIISENEGRNKFILSEHYNLLIIKCYF